MYVKSVFLKTIYCPNALKVVLSASGHAHTNSSNFKHTYKLYIFTIKHIKSRTASSIRNDVHMHGYISCLICTLISLA
jgi:hypothetical protein